MPVFNGEHSEVFVDGRREGPEVEADVGQGFLDGFTIGADHRNDFPLGCTAEGSDQNKYPLFRRL